ncbi:hypothetical protein F2P81_017988 [Scophthalmus maximus]|uniref:Uncharacterized protein n=1 Tax=Scophthalmus maximus TaxID=52904 RepID=A0A6A4S3E0_SCOMX|nr:hypothetical protein F2P81_017988 [Scophthalmus maximus]
MYTHDVITVKGLSHIQMLMIMIRRPVGAGGGGADSLGPGPAGRGLHRGTDGSDEPGRSGRKHEASAGLDVRRDAAMTADQELGCEGPGLRAASGPVEAEEKSRSRSRCQQNNAPEDVRFLPAGWMELYDGRTGGEPRGVASVRLRSVGSSC